MITLGLNLALIPLLGYMGSAITTMLVYFSMMIASYFLGQKYYPIKYNLRKIGLYLISAILIVGLSFLVQSSQITFHWSNFIGNGFLLILFVGIILFIERPMRQFKKG